MASRASAPLTHYADPAHMADWLETASPRAVLIYASGSSLGGGGHPAAVLARTWREEKRVALFVVRSRTRAEALDYCAKKLSVQPAAASAGNGTALPARWEDGPEGAVFRLLKRLAEEDAACPSNDAIAEALNLRDRYAARYRFDRLVKWGLIRVVTAERFAARVVEITATGTRTRPSNNVAGGTPT